MEETKMSNTIVWADIPVADMDRARKFYGAVLQAEIPLMEGSDGSVALLPMEPGDASADLVLSDRKPTSDGATVYLNGNGDPQGMIDRAVAAGGQVLRPLADMGDMVGSIGYIQDSEGNRLGVHQPPKMA
jgi:uncharacterized protein